MRTIFKKLLGVAAVLQVIFICRSFFPLNANSSFLDGWKTRNAPQVVPKPTLPYDEYSPSLVLWGVVFIHSGGPDRDLLTQSSWMSNLASIKYSLERHPEWRFVVLFCDDSKDGFVVGDDNMTFSALQEFPNHIELFRERSTSKQAKPFMRIRDNVIFSYTYLYNHFFWFLLTHTHRHTDRQLKK